MDNRAQALALFQEGYEKIIEGLDRLGYSPREDPNFDDTPARAARGLAELIADRNETRAEITEVLTKTVPAKYREMVISKYNVAFGMCPHHLLPVIYRVSLAYIPTKKVLGISKLSRMVRLMSRSPTLQEDLTHELCNLLYTGLESEGSAVYVEGLHLCMAARGVSSHEARVVTSAVQGVFLDNLATREEFIKLVTASHPTLI
ncbi:MAG TPA: GTP cyclohydrolase I [Kofleriaceae bacterium]|nr:GTP cyclohydrolase I [Kofleriaceae bacterium]